MNTIIDDDTLRENVDEVNPILQKKTRKKTPDVWECFKSVQHPKGDGNANIAKRFS